MLDVLLVIGTVIAVITGYAIVGILVAKLSWIIITSETVIRKRLQDWNWDDDVAPVIFGVFWPIALIGLIPVCLIAFASSWVTEDREDRKKRIEKRAARRQERAEMRHAKRAPQRLEKIAKELS